MQASRCKMTVCELSSKGWSVDRVGQGELFAVSDRRGCSGPPPADQTRRPSVPTNALDRFRCPRSHRASAVRVMTDGCWCLHLWESRGPCARPGPWALSGTLVPSRVLLRGDASGVAAGNVRQPPPAATPPDRTSWRRKVAVQGDLASRTEAVPRRPLHSHERTPDDPSGPATGQQCRVDGCGAVVRPGTWVHT